MDFTNRVGACCAVLAHLCCVTAAADQHQYRNVAEDQYDLRRLMEPSAAELASEANGRVHIYDSLEIGEVNTALDQNFDRIQSMMFTRIHHLPPTGAGPTEVEDDGCD